VTLSRQRAGRRQMLVTARSSPKMGRASKRKGFST
jgi:hypothetical protein